MYSSRTFDPVRIAQHAEDCRGLLTHLGVERAQVVGHSFGGCIVLQLALDTPEIVHSLALIETGLMIGASGGPYWEALARGGQHYREVGTTVVLNEFLQALAGLPGDGHRRRRERVLQTRSPGYRKADAAMIVNEFLQRARRDTGSASIAWCQAPSPRR